MTYNAWICIKRASLSIVQFWLEVIHSLHVCAGMCLDVCVCMFV